MMVPLYIAEISPTRFRGRMEIHGRLGRRPFDHPGSFTFLLSIGKRVPLWYLCQYITKQPNYSRPANLFSKAAQMLVLRSSTASIPTQPMLKS